MSSTDYALAPLTANGPLQIAIVGPNQAGKTALLKHFLNHVHESIIQPRPPSPPARPRHPILARLASSRLGTILARTVHLAFSFIRRLQRENPTSSRHDVLPAPDAHPLTLFDTKGAFGLHSLYNDAVNVDVVLYVTRLDHTRADRYDMIMLGEVVDVFGNEVLDRLIVVLTRGCALPPMNLTYHEYVRGRSDLLTSYMRHVWPPVVVRSHKKESTDATEGSDNESVSEEAPEVSGGIIKNASAEQDDVSNITFMTGALHGFHLYPRPREEQEQGQLHPTVKSVVAALVNDDDTDEGSVSAIPEDFLDPLFDAGVHPEDKRVFRDPATPVFAVVELSDACTTNSNAEKLLPDGTPWFSNLITAITEVSHDAPRKAAERLVRKKENIGPPPLKFASRFQEMLHSISKDALRIFIIQMALIFLMWQVGFTVDRAKKRREKRAVEKDESDVLLELNDDEYDKLTRPDPGSGGQAEIVIDPGDEEKIDLEESEEDFFRRDDPNRKKKKATTEEVPEPMPELPTPLGPNTFPGLYDDEQQSSGSPKRKRAGQSQNEEKNTTEDKGTVGYQEKEPESNIKQAPSPPDTSAKGGSGNSPEGNKRD